MDGRFTTRGSLLAVLALSACSATAPAPAPEPELHWLDVPALQTRLRQGSLTSKRLTQALLTRIERLDGGAIGLNAVVERNPDAPAIAAQRDVERRGGRIRGPLHGIPVLLKENIDTGDRMLTTAGSLALLDAPLPDDAFLVARLRAAGAVVLGKTNISEWANFRSTQATSGWSARGGQTRNPFDRRYNPCGSSAGSAVAVAAGMVPLAVGTETNGSITCPASANGVVGIKPTLGLVSRNGIVPIAISQDTAGPLARSVADAALLLQAMAAWDTDDPLAQPARRVPDFSAALGTDALAGARLGVLRNMTGFDAATDRLFEFVLARLRAAGATLVEVELQLPSPFDDDSYTVLLHEFRDGIERYLATRGAAITTLDGLIAFNRLHAVRAMPHFGQEIFEQAASAAALGDRDYRTAHVRSRTAARAAIDALLNDHDLDALIAPTMAPAWRTNYARGDDYRGAGVSATPAVAGYPHISVPMGLVDGLPVGLSLIGAPWRDAELIGLADAWERLAALDLRPPLAGVRE
jgi:amidase